MRGEPVSQAARIFTELLINLQERLHFQTKLSRLQGCSTDHLRNVLRSVHYQKERENARIRCEDDLIGEVAISGTLDKQMKQHLTHFSFEAVELLQPQLTFRLERHYVNLGKLFSSYFQSMESREHCQRLMATFNSAGSAFKLQYYVGLLRLFFEHLRTRFNKAVKEATASIIAQLKSEEQLYRSHRGPGTETQEDQYNMYSMISPSVQHAYTGRSRSRRSKPSPQKIMFQSAMKQGIEHIEQKLQEINEAMEGSASNRYGPQPSFRLQTTYLDPITVQGSSRNLNIGLPQPPRHSFDKQQKLLPKKDPSTLDTQQFPEKKAKYYIKAVESQPLVTDPPIDGLELNKADAKKRTLRRNNISEDYRKNYSVLVNTQPKLPPLNQSPETAPQQQIPSPEVKRYFKNPANKRKYDQFMELFGNNMLGTIVDAIPDLDVDYHRERKKHMGVDKDAWIEEHMESVVVALLAENSQASNSISRFSLDYYNSQATKETRLSSLSKLQRRRILERPGCRTLLVGGYSTFGQRDWRR